MKVASISSFNYQQCFNKHVNPVQKSTQEKLNNSKAQNVNFEGCKWTVGESATWAFLGGIVGGPIGVGVGALIGAIIGSKLDDEDP